MNSPLKFRPAPEADPNIVFINAVLSHPVSGPILAARVAELLRPLAPGTVPQAWQDKTDAATVRPGGAA